MSNGTIIWNELVTPDTEAACVFYCRLFGWIRQELDMGDQGVYTIFMKDGVNVAGMMVNKPGLGAPRWHTYFNVDDLDASVEQAVALGGTILEQPVEIPGVGRICLLTDPFGIPVSLMTPMRGENMS